LVAVTLVPLVGCATMPKTGAPATGEPLSVQGQVVTDRHQVREKVGEVRYEDSAGRSLGKSDVYQDRTVYSNRLVWGTYQGLSRIDDYDFFKIAGDHATAQEVEDYRRTGVVMNRTGWGMVLGGLAVGLGGNAALHESSPGAGTGLLLGGTLVASIGAALAYWGFGRTSADAHPVDIGRAHVAAAQYNASLGTGGSQVRDSGE
jgi:hypothetical protein